MHEWSLPSKEVRNRATSKTPPILGLGSGGLANPRRNALNDVITSFFVVVVVSLIVSCLGVCVREAFIMVNWWGIEDVSAVPTRVW